MKRRIWREFLQRGFVTRVGNGIFVSVLLLEDDVQRAALAQLRRC